MTRIVRRVTVAVAVLATLTAFGGTAASAGSGAPTVANPGFEAGLAGWKVRGDAAASVVEAGGHTGSFRLTHRSTSDRRVETSQQLSRLANADYTLRAWVRSSGGQADLVLRDCGSASVRMAVPRTGGAADPWVQVALGVRVTRHACTIVLASAGGPGAWLQMDDVEFTRGSHDGRLPIRGADVSHLTKNVDHGAVYRDAHGRVADPLGLLEVNGVNYARLKVWVDPADGYNGKADVLRKARWAKARGMRLLIDFHYSDAWADPGKQNKPATWTALPFDELRQALYDHTYDVLAALWAQGTPAAMAQVGNEINGGLLWPDGRWDNWDGLAALLTAGAQAVHAASPSTKVVLHLAEGGNNGGHRWWFDNAVARGVPFDVIAVSHYTYWHGTLGALQANLMDLSTRYGKPVMVTETAYGFTTAEQDHEANIFTQALADTAGWPATPAGQAQALRDLCTTVAAVPGALGIFYWEPTWTAVSGAGWDPADPTSGDGWENQALFDYSGRALPAMRVFKELA